MKVSWRREDWWNKRKMVWPWTEPWLRRMQTPSHRQQMLEEASEVQAMGGRRALEGCAGCPFVSQLLLILFVGSMNIDLGPLNIFPLLMEWRSAVSRGHWRGLVGGVSAQVQAGVLTQQALLCTSHGFLSIWLLPVVQLPQSLCPCSARWPVRHRPRNSFPWDSRGQISIRLSWHGTSDFSATQQAKAVASPTTAEPQPRSGGSSWDAQPWEY